MRSLALIGCATSTQAIADAGSQDAQLSVTATVIRPVQISTVSSNFEDRVIAIRNVAAVEVVAVGGTVNETEQDRTIVTSDGSSQLTLTLIY